MNYEDTQAWPNIPVEEIEREDLATLYSFGHYDGPGTGLVRWGGACWYVSRFELHDNRFWVIALTSEQQEYALRYGKAWAEHFHSGMTWSPEGSRAPRKDGQYALRTPNHLTYSEDGRKAFASKFPHRPTPDEDAKVVGYFNGWRL